DGILQSSRAQHGLNAVGRVGQHEDRLPSEVRRFADSLPHGTGWYRSDEENIRLGFGDSYYLRVHRGVAYFEGQLFNNIACLGAQSSLDAIQEVRTKVVVLVQ